MIKKILCAMLLCLTTINAYSKSLQVTGGNNPIDLYAGRAINVLRKHIPNESEREDVINAILTMAKNHQSVSASRKHAIELDDFEALCDIAGFDRSTHKGVDKCVAFVKAMINLSYDKYSAVCQDIHEKITGVTERCIDDFFFHKGTIADTQVTKLQAEGLCKEYARVKYGDDIECSGIPRNEGGLNEYIQCRSKTDAIYYEFKFDDVVENKDLHITESVKDAICKIHDTKQGSTAIIKTAGGFTTEQRLVDTCDNKNGGKLKDKVLCSKINETAQKFAYKTYTDDIGYCVLDYRDDINLNTLRTAFGINNKAFKTGYQLSAYAGMREQLCEYIKANADVTITDCECDYDRRRIGDDDVLTCYAAGQPIDFIFDDLSEGDKTVRQGNMEAFNCTVLGGEYQGKTCFTPDKKLCDQIAAATIAECPKCAKAYFDTEKNACVLPNAADAIQHQKKVYIGLLVGGTIVNAGLTFYFGGANWAYFVLALETIGAAMEFGEQIHIDGVADDFLVKANNCNNATCAEEILKEYFLYLARMTNDLQDGEKLGVDSKMAALVEMLPDDSQFLIDVVAGCYEDNGDGFDISQCDDGNWNAAQVIRAVGIGLQFTSLIGAGLKAALGAQRIAKIADKAPNLTKALSKKIPGVKSKITQKLSKGEKVLRSDSKPIKGVMFNIDGSDVVSDAIKSENTLENGTKSSKPIGFLREFGKSSETISDVISNLEKDGYRVVSVEDPYSSKYKIYKIFADNEHDVEKAQKMLLETASSEIDRDARLGIVGNYYDPRHSDTWYEMYRKEVTEMLSKDPEVAKAKENWDKMDEYERWKFDHQTNRKIRRQLINEDAFPVSYARVKEKGTGAAYIPQRIGSEAEKMAKELEGFDAYKLNPKEDSFDKTIEHLVHENYHYAQDMGKTETPKWLLDFNADNYTTRGGVVYGDYHQQPLEAGVKGLGHKVSSDVIRNLDATDLEKLGYKINSSEYVGLKKFSVSDEDIERMLFDGGDFSEIKGKLASIEEEITPNLAKTFDEDVAVARWQINILENFVDDYPNMFVYAKRSENIGDNLRHFNIDIEEMGLAIADRQYTYRLDDFISKYKTYVSDAEDALLQIQKQDLLPDDLVRYLMSEIETAQENIRFFDRLDETLKEHNYIGSVGYYGPDPDSTNLYEQLQYWAKKFNVDDDLDYMTSYDYQRLSGAIKSNIEEAKSFVGGLYGREGDVFYDLLKKVNQEAERAENVLRKTDNIVFYEDHPSNSDLRNLFDGVVFVNY